jgi:hypothetical protein
MVNPAAGRPARVVTVQRAEIALYALALAAVVAGCTQDEAFTKTAPVAVPQQTQDGSAYLTPPTSTTAAVGGQIGATVGTTQAQPTYATKPTRYLIATTPNRGPTRAGNS